MKFVKVWQEERCRYFFEDAQGQICSPTFVDIDSAQHWRDAKARSDYRGDERRYRVYDRRVQLKKRERLNADSTSPTRMGRRAIDLPLYVSEDRVNLGRSDAYARYTQFYT